LEPRIWRAKTLLGLSIVLVFILLADTVLVRVGRFMVPRTADNWWSRRIGIYEFVEEVAKTTYYYLRGFLRIDPLNDPQRLKI